MYAIYEPSLTPNLNWKKNYETIQNTDWIITKKLLTFKCDDIIVVICKRLSFRHTY